MLAISILDRGKNYQLPAIRSLMTKPEDTTAGYRNGKKTPEYQAWQNMRKRCLSPRAQRYANYGGRGITVCQRWRRFENFIADMGRRPTARHTLERKDNDGPYAKWNCRWATQLEQGQNRRSCHYVEYAGEKRTIAAWARIHGLSDSLLRYRLRVGWSLDKAMKPAKKYRKSQENKPSGRG